MPTFRLEVLILGTLAVIHSSFRSVESQPQELKHTIGLQYTPHCIFSLPGATYRRFSRHHGTSQTCTCISVAKADCQPDQPSGKPPANDGSNPTNPGSNSPAGPNGPNGPTDPNGSTGPNHPNRPTATANAVPHPLDPLTPDEIIQTKNVILSTFSRITSRQQAQRFIFTWITLKEPPKSVLLPYFLSNRNAAIGVYPRKSYSVLIERITGNASEVVVNLNKNKLESITPVPHGFQPTLSLDELKNSQNIAKRDPEVQRRCQLLGYPNMSLVQADPWSMGYVGDRKEFDGKRLTQLYLYGQNFDRDNYYPHPFDFIVIVDLVKEKVIGFEELPTHDGFNASDNGINTVPTTPNNYDYKLLPPNFLRTDDRPILSTSPSGPSYRVDGYEILWQKFKLRLGFNGREGLVIYNVNYNDSGSFRPILYRAAVSEMHIPYGDPRPPFHRKAAFDMGEYGLGFFANQLKPNQDCLGDVQYFDGVLSNSTGDPVLVKNAICVHEEDAGVLWKHTNINTGDAVLVRSHRLVLSFIATIGTYDYIFLWRFYQDGSIELQVQLTGILSINLLAINSTQGGNGITVFPQNNAQYHQHFFSVRLDTEIDGTRNSIFTSEAVPIEDDTNSHTNPYGQGFTTRRVDLTTASNARTDISPLTSKVWVVTNPSSKHPYTKTPVGWKLLPMNSAPGLLKNDSPLRPKAAFLDYDVWVTRYNEDQRFSGGLWLNNSGLPEWVASDPNASLDNTDIVLWHNFGLTHIPRAEDYPVMPVEMVGFWFKPFNFFLQNPALDVPPASAPNWKTEL